MKQLTPSRRCVAGGVPGLPSRGRRRWMTVALTALLVVAAACSESSGSDSAAPSTSAPGAKAASCATDLIACARESTLGPLVPDNAARATGTPIVLGMVNQENTPAGSFPELSKAVEAGIAFVNDQLGGVDGHPLRLDLCNTKFSAEGSTACGQRFAEARVPAVLGGIDVFGNAIDVLRDNDIPYVGGIPVSDQSVRSSNSYQFSGGSWGAIVAFADFSIKTLKAKKVAIVHGDFGSVSESARYGKEVLERAGVEVQLVPHPILATDLSSPIQVAGAGKPDALILVEADTGCKGSFEARQTLGIAVPTFYVGACVAPSIINDVDVKATDGAIFNVEGPVLRESPSADTSLYSAVIDRYGKDVDASSAATVSFRGFMNLYVVLRELGAASLTPSAISNAFGAKVDAPSFMGHSYTCDRRQFKGLPAMCSPQEILARMKNRLLYQIGSWIDVGKVYAG